MRAFVDLLRAVWRRFVAWFVGVMCGAVWLSADGTELGTAAADIAVNVILVVWIVFELRAAVRARDIRKLREAADADRERTANEKRAARDAAKLTKQLAADTGTPGA